MSGLLTGAYVSPPDVRAFFGPAATAAGPPQGVDAAPRMDRSDAAPALVVPLVVTAATGLVLGLADLGGIFSLTAAVAGAVTGGAP